MRSVVIHYECTVSMRSIEMQADVAVYMKKIMPEERGLNA